MILFLPESTEGVAAGQTTAMDYEREAESADYTEETVAKQDNLNKSLSFLGALWNEQNSFSICVTGDTLRQNVENSLM